MNAQIVDIDDPRLVKALAHPIRMKILTILGERTSTPKELAATLGLPLENVSYHVRTLKDFGFIKLEKTRQVRGAVEHHYKLAARPRIGNKLWAQIPRVVQEAMVDANLSVIVDALGAAALEGGFDRGNAHMAQHVIRLDDEGFEEVQKVLSEAQDQIEKIATKSEKRAGDEAKRASVAFFLFETPSSLPAEEATEARDAARRRRQQKSTA
jgi:DNA-binding transcriptional ArsR family regulator